MDVLIEYLSDLKKKLNISEIFKAVIDSKMKDFIIELNQNQLFDLGEDSEGKRLFSFLPDQPYAPYTIFIKEQSGLPSDRLTLFQTGAFYKSFKVEVEGNDIILDADGQKEDSNLFEDYGEDILGLNSQNMAIFIERLQNNVIFYIKNK